VTKRSAFKHEFITLLKLAFPIYLAELSTAAVSFVDTLMAGLAGTNDLAGVAVGSSLWVGIAVFIIGLFLAVNPVVASLTGSKRHRRVQRFVQQSIWVSIFVMIMVIILFSFKGPLLSAVIDDPAVREIASDYLFGLSFGIPAFILYAILRPYSEGISFTRPHMVSAFVGLATNIPANYILIFGHFGAPALGGAGCGWATSISLWCMLFVMLIYTHKHAAYRLTRLHQFRYKICFDDIKTLLRVGLPIAFTIFVEASIFAFITLFLGSLPASSIAGHQIAMSVAYILYIFPLSVSFAVSVRVGYNLGQKQPELAKLAAWASIALCIVIATFNASILLLQPEWIASWYTDDLVVQQMAVSLMFFAALFQVSDAIVTPIQGILRGYYDTTMALMMNILAYWIIALPLGYSLGLTDWITPALGAKGFWISLVIGLTVGGALLFPRFLWISREKTSTEY
jgi:multidrug resistance protein, MATE family